jgi:hypothetical protein
LSIGVTTISADNGIYVLFTESEKNGPQYRVAHLQAIDNIYGKFSEEKLQYEGNPEIINDYFGGAQVFYTLNEALDYAEEVENKIGYTEDGICVIKEFAHHGYIFD